MLYAIVAVLVLLLDQGLKYWVSLNLPLNEGSLVLIPGVIQLTHVHNYGAAFGMLENLTWLFMIVTVLFCAVVIYVLATKKIASRFGCWLALLIMAGAIGNGIDRVICGYVVDMFDLMFPLPFFGDFAIFNVADCFITVCGFLFCGFLIFSKDPLPGGDAPDTGNRAKKASHSKTKRLAKREEDPIDDTPSARATGPEPKPAAPSHAEKAPVVHTQVVSPDSTVPAAKAPAAKAAPVETSDDEFSLESILAEFGGK